MNLTGGKAHKISLYLLDWDSSSRAETISFTDANSNGVLDTKTFSGFHDREYATWKVKGHVLIRVTLSERANPVVNGIFFDRTLLARRGCQFSHIVGFLTTVKSKTRSSAIFSE